MQAINIEILNPNALQLIEGMQKLKLIKINKIEKPDSGLKEYLKKMRKKAVTVPGDDDILKIVKQVRKERYAKKD